MWVAAEDSSSTNDANSGDAFRCVSTSNDATRDAVGTVLAYNAIPSITAYKQLVVVLEATSPAVHSELDCKVSVAGELFDGAARGCFENHIHVLWRSIWAHKQNRVILSLNRLPTLYRAQATFQSNLAVGASNNVQARRRG